MPSWPGSGLRARGGGVSQSSRLLLGRNHVPARQVCRSVDLVDTHLAHTCLWRGFVGGWGVSRRSWPRGRAYRMPCRACLYSLVYPLASGRMPTYPPYVNPAAYHFTRSPRQHTLLMNPTPNLRFRLCAQPSWPASQLSSTLTSTRRWFASRPGVPTGSARHGCHSLLSQLLPCVAAPAPPPA